MLRSQPLSFLQNTYGTGAVNAWNPFADDKDNNGNVRRALHYVPLNDAISSYVIPQLQDYQYDHLNRITSVSEKCKGIIPSL